MREKESSAVEVVEDDFCGTRGADTVQDSGNRAMCFDKSEVGAKRLQGLVQVSKRLFHPPS